MQSNWGLSATPNGTLSNTHQPSSTFKSWARYGVKVLGSTAGATIGSFLCANVGLIGGLGVGFVAAVVFDLAIAPLGPESILADIPVDISLLDFGANAGAWTGGTWGGYEGGNAGDEYSGEAFDYLFGK